MTTYTTPHFATGVPDRSNVRPDPALNRARPASAAPYRTAGVTNEAALMSEGQTPDWQPGVSKGVPKAAIGALGAALVGGVALAIVLMAPSNKVTKQVMPDPIAQAAANNTAGAKAADGSTDAAVNQMDKDAPAAGNTAAAADATTSTAAPAAGAEPVVPAPVQAVIPDAPPVANAPVARVPRAKAAPAVTPRVAPQPVQSAPVVTPDATVLPAVTPPADVQPPAMQQTPDTPTVTPSTPVPAPTPDTPAPTPAPAQ
jgi:hypothetical protein